MKRIVVCCDGTWNTPDQQDNGKPSPTNVVRTVRTVAERDSGGRRQLVYYDEGVGTRWFDHLTGGAFGYGLSANIRQAYRYLVRHYQPGDEIFLFGFSRGAYTARSTAGLIRNCGLLKRKHIGRIDEAYAFYRRRDDASHPTGAEAQDFRRKYSQEIRIKFIGVWDTVGALGIPFGILRFFNRVLEFHDVKLSSYVENAFQALAIDEKRKFFVPAIWEQQAHAADQVLEQAWFAGAHSNVGGGYADSGLSDIAFLWIKNKAERCGLAFNEDYVAANIHPDVRGVLRDSKTWIYRLIPDYLRPIGGEPKPSITARSSGWSSG
jgi:uncharacterized protein (DUF2235 family)